MMWWMLLGALPIDPVGDPLPRYLTTLDVTEQLKLVEPALQACDIEGEHTQGVELQVHGDGTVQSIVWQESDVSAYVCWAAALEAHRFQPHDGEPIRVSTTVYVRNGELMLSPQPTVFPRRLGPLMLFVLPEKAELVYEYMHGGPKASER